MNECTPVTFTTKYLNSRVFVFFAVGAGPETSLPASSAGVMPVAVTPLKLSDSRSTGTSPFSGEQGKEARDHGA